MNTTLTWLHFSNRLICTERIHLLDKRSFWELKSRGRIADLRPSSSIPLLKKWISVRIRNPMIQGTYRFMFYDEWHFLTLTG